MRGQITIEFIIINTLGLLFFLAIAAAITFDWSQTDIQAEKQQLEVIGSKIQSEIITASRMNDGFNRTVQLPETILNKNYTIQTYYRLFTLKSDAHELFFSIPQLTGNITKSFSLQKQGEALVIT